MRSVFVRDNSSRLYILQFIFIIDILIHIYFLMIYLNKGAATLQKLGGPNRAKPESRARSARDLRAKPESRASPRKSGGRDLGRGLGEPLPRKFLEFRTSNSSIWCILETEILI